MELTDLHHKEILKEIILFEQCRFNINVFLKSRSDGRSEIQDEMDRLRSDLSIFLIQNFKLKSLMKTYKDINLEVEFRELQNKINELIEELLKYREKGVDSKIQTIVNSDNEISEKIYDAIKKAT